MYICMHAYFSVFKIVENRKQNYRRYLGAKFAEDVIGQNVAYYEFCHKIAATVWTTTPHYVRISWNVLHWKQHQKSCSPTQP